jgi:hypothetical protein
MRLTSGAHSRYGTTAMHRALLALLALALLGCQPRPAPSAPAVVPAAILVEPRALSLRAGDSAQLSAQVNDALGQPIGGAPIAYGTSDPGVVRVTARGLATSTGQAGSAQILVSSGDQSAAVTVTVSPGPVKRLEKAGGDGQRGVVGTALEEGVSVKAVDAYGNPVAGARVLFSTPDGGAASPPAATTSATGAASTTWTLGTSPGPQRLFAALEIAPGAAKLFTATAHAGAPARLSAAAQPAPAAAGSEVVVRVSAADSAGNAVPGAEVTWRALSAGTAISPPTSVTDAEGVAEARVETAGAAGKNRIEARAKGPAQPLELTLETVSGPPARVEVTKGDRQSASARRPVRTAPVVRVVDAYGNPVAGVRLHFTVSGGGAIQDDAPVTDAKGVASCGRWTLGAPGANALAVAADGVAQPVRIVATARRR